MNIIEACKSGKKFRRPCWAKGYYCELHIDGRLISQDGSAICIDKERLLATDYELYEEGIRPKENEVWHLKNVGDCYIVNKDNTLCRVWNDGTVDSMTDLMIHEVNGWQRLFPVVEDERVDMGEIEWVRTSKGIVNYISPVRPDKESLHNEYLYLAGKPGKLIFIPNK